MRSGLVVVVFRIVAAVFVVLSFAACAKKSGDAVVVEKEHIDKRVAGASPAATADSTPNPEPTIREMRPDEIDVDGLVMKKEDRGTSKDPRAFDEEQWRVRVRLVDGGRQFVVRTDRAHYEKLNPGDRVKVRYSEGKYTSTVWSSEFVD
jgi:hypothetical protein